MFRIVKKEVLSPKITLLEIEAPYIARKAQPGQFIIFRIDEQGERVPLTIGGYDREKGTITIIFQRAGLSPVPPDGGRHWYVWLLPCHCRRRNEVRMR